MFHHVVLMQFTAKVDGSFFDNVEKHAEGIRRTAPNLHKYLLRRNLASRSDGLTHGIVASFATAADHDAYQISPAHQAMKAYMTPYIARIVVCDIDEAQP
ncbi:MAG: hypothetical protein A3G81_06420 [Betaproteobacteria bacterium RIFCSPLOWO2_12_FULL_65_14]|nr:MAG: hypothetical protein A3G81_06420 [Betaproteobacteria bacterium RIFCSPLOWO2_12_FULL_65_14]